MPATRAAKSATLEAIFDQLHDLLSRYAPPLKIGGRKIRSKRDFHLTVPKPVVVPGAYSNKPVELDVASIILQKGYVGFYLMAAYIDPSLKKKLSPALVATLKGKTCFHITKPYPNLLPDAEAALNEAIHLYKSRFWL